MATFRSGQGGSIAIGGGSTLVVTKWEVDTGIREVENTHSGCGGFDNYEKVLTQIAWSAEGPWDEENQPDVDAGTLMSTTNRPATVTFTVGSGAKTIVLANTLIVGFKHICNASGDIVRWTMSGKGASALTRTTT